MCKRLIMSFLLVAAGFAWLFATGCETDAQTGALIGTAAGAGVGQAIGRNTGGTLIGAGVGAAAGYMLGNEGDKKKAQQRQQSEMSSMRQDMNTELVNVTNSNGSIIQVRVTRQGVGWVGPRGEYYSHLPTSEELRPVYGF